MVVGDVVGDISVVATLLDFQPAAGVEAVITAITMDANVGFDGNYYDGTRISNLQTTAAGFAMDPSNIKLFITNTNYLRINSVPAKSTGFTGVQIK